MIKKNSGFCLLAATSLIQLAQAQSLKLPTACNLADLVKECQSNVANAYEATIGSYNYAPDGKSVILTSIPVNLLNAKVIKIQENAGGADCNYDIDFTATINDPNFGDDGVEGAGGVSKNVGTVTVSAKRSGCFIEKMNLDQLPINQ